MILYRSGQNSYFVLLGAALSKLVDPKPETKFVRFVSVYRPREMPGQVKYTWYSWPYFEGLRMDEAMHPLCFMVTGLYGKPLPKQNGAPIRMVLPWKYGYKSPKSIVKVEFIASQPDTFWHKSAPGEYGFYSNVNPRKPHPRWSQANEKLLPDMDRRPTLPYNGYEKLYNGKEDQLTGCAATLSVNSRALRPSVAHRSSADPPESRTSHTW